MSYCSADTPDDFADVSSLVSAVFFGKNKYHVSPGSNTSDSSIISGFSFKIREFYEILIFKIRKHSFEHLGL